MRTDVCQWQAGGALRDRPKRTKKDRTKHNYLLT